MSFLYLLQIKVSHVTADVLYFMWISIILLNLFICKLELLVKIIMCVSYIKFNDVRTQMSMTFL